MTNDACSPLSLLSYESHLNKKGFLSVHAIWSRPINLNASTEFAIPSGNHYQWLTREEHHRFE